MKNAFKAFMWVWFILVAIAGVIWIRSTGGYASGIVDWAFVVLLLSGWTIVFWTPVALLCEFGIVVLNHFELVERHNMWMEKTLLVLTSNSKMMADKFSQIAFEEE